MMPNIRVTVDTKRLEGRLAKLAQRTGPRLIEAINRWGNQVLVPVVLKSATNVGLKMFRSNGLFRNTRFRRTTKGGELWMPKSGFYQDRAKDHWVPPAAVAKYPMLRAWSLSRRGAIKGFYFHHRPFIHNGVKSAVSLAPSYWRKAIRDSLREH